MIHMKILFAAFEAEPFAKTGGLGEVCGSLPGALRARGGRCARDPAEISLPSLRNIRTGCVTSPTSV